MSILVPVEEGRLSPRPTTRISRQLLAELRLQFFSRTVLYLALVMAAGVVAAFVGSLSAARSAHEFFVSQVHTFESHGISLRDALSQPLTVTQDGNQQTISNPLKYDYLQVGTSVQAVDGVLDVIGIALDLVTFIVMPLAFLIYGANAAMIDRRSRTMKLRCSLDRWRDVTVAKLLAIVPVAGVATVVTVVAGVLTWAVGRGQVAELTSSIPYALTSSESVSGLGAKLLMTVGVATLFGVVGYAVGAVTGSTSWPMVLAAVALFMLPFSSRWDPRNLLATLAVDVYDFSGQFRMRPPLPIEPVYAALVLVGCLVVAVALALTFPRGERRFR